MIFMIKKKLGLPLSKEEKQKEKQIVEKKWYEMYWLRLLLAGRGGKYPRCHFEGPEGWAPCEAEEIEEEEEDE